jgi:hypothetical protein
MFHKLSTCRQTMSLIRGSTWYYFLLTYIYAKIQRLMNIQRFFLVCIHSNPYTEHIFFVFLMLSSIWLLLLVKYLFIFLWDLTFHNFCCSWMIMRWMKSWKSCSRITKSGANILVARVAFGDFLRDLFTILLFICDCWFVLLWMFVLKFFVWRWDLLSWFLMVA